MLSHYLLGVLFMAVVSASVSKASQKPVRFYVAPDGNDAWSGKLPRPNRDRTDGPFATIARARDAIRELKRAQGDALKRPVTVYIRGGIYFLGEPIVFTPRDSGTSQCPIAYKAYRNEKPIISGGKLITGWKEVTIDGRRLWAVELPEVRDGKWFFRQLWVNGHRRRRARHPNKGYLKVAEVPDVTSNTPWHQGQMRIRFHNGNLKAWKTISDAELVLMSRWVESHVPIVSVDEEKRIVAFGKRTVFRPDPNDLYYIEHAFELLDEPGEWYLDRKAGVLYYMPMPNEDMDKAEVIAPVLAQLIRLQGEPAIGQFVEHISFRKLTFSHTEWALPEGRSGFAQAAVNVPGAIYGEGVRECAFEGCNFTHIGTYAIELSRGCAYNRIIACEISDLGAGGVKIGEPRIRDDDAEQTHNNEITDCHIYDGGRFFHSAVGIWIGQSYDNRIAHNHIHDFYYTGISIGWTWGYGRALARDNIVEFNHVHHIGVRSDGDGPILSDMGGIYTLGRQPGTVIRHNLFHDIAGYRYGGWGIYFDEGSTHIVAENNIVYRTTHGGFHQHYGRENVVRNNIFAFGRDAQIQRSRPEPHLSFTFERNIVYWREGRLLVGNLSNFNFAFDYNLYWCEGNGEIRFGNFTWDEWRAKGMDENSIIADPLFVAPERDNFKLKRNSPALKLGFKRIDLRRVGIRKKVWMRLHGHRRASDG